MRMKHLKTRGIAITLAVVAMLVSSCERDVDYTYLDSSPLVTVVYPYVALGDRAFSDSVYVAVSRHAAANGWGSRHIVLSENEEMDSMLVAVAREARERQRRQLLLVATGAANDAVARAVSQLPSDGDTRLVALDTDEALAGVSTVSIPLYGPCYLAGLMVAPQIYEAIYSQNIIVCANNKLSSIVDGANGYEEGCRVSRPELSTERMYLSPDIGGGFEYEKELLTLTQKNSLLYDAFVMALCGGSQNGLLTSNNITMSMTKWIGSDNRESGNVSILGTGHAAVVRHVDSMIRLLFSQWTTGTLPSTQRLTMADGYSDFYADSYAVKNTLRLPLLKKEYGDDTSTMQRINESEEVAADFYQAICEKYKQQAIEAERSYYANK